MRPINPKKSKVFSFLLGLVYGYRTADFSLKSFKMEDFDPEDHPEGDVYYLNREKDLISKNEPIEDPTHIVILKEDMEAKKVRIYIYRA